MGTLAVDAAPRVETAPLCTADITALAEVINRRGLYSAAPESENFYASPAGARGVAGAGVQPQRQKPPLP